MPKAVYCNAIFSLLFLAQNDLQIHPSKPRLTVTVGTILEARESAGKVLKILRKQLKLLVAYSKHFERLISFIILLHFPRNIPTPLELKYPPPQLTFVNCTY